MGNVNVNRTNSEPDTPLPLEGVQFPFSINVVWLVVAVSSALLIFWLVFIGLAIQSCGATAIPGAVIAPCLAYLIAFWSAPSIVGFAVLLGIFAAIQYVINMGYLSNLGVKIHRRDARKSAERGFDTMIQRARSESTRGLDTWSPSNSNSNTTNKDALIETDMSDLDLLGLNLTQGFDNANAK